MALNAAVLATAGVVVLIPTFNALSSSGYTPDEAPFNMDNPPDVEPPDNPPDVEPPPGSGGQGGGDGRYEPPPPSCDREQPYVLFDESYGPGRDRPLTLENLTLENGTVAVQYGAEFQSYKGNFLLEVWRDGDALPDRLAYDAVFDGPVTYRYMSERYTIEDPDERWELNLEADDNMVGGVRVAVVGFLENCERAENEGASA